MRVLAVAVTYNPDATMLAEALQSVTSQVQGLAIIDNGSINGEAIHATASTLGSRVIANKDNIGIAAAQNQGVELARQGGYSHVLLLDQDTILTPGVVSDLMNHLTALEAVHGRVAAVGPAYSEVHSGQKTRAYRATGLRLSRISLEGQTQPVESDSIIASGSLIPLAVLDEVGPVREDLFIDLVDVEWCFRARAAGYKSYLSPTAAVDHHLGKGTVSIGRRRIAVHVPVRNYYWIRNALWLARQTYTPLAWKLYFLSRCLAFLTAYSTLVDQRTLRLHLMCRGAWDSLHGRFGPLR
jgi:rhamnosyltransferase